MKATDLMVGDLVMVHPSGMLIKVAAVHNKKVAYHACPNKLEWVRRDLLKPVPLTAEILEKNGFNQDKYGQFILNEDTGESEHYLCIVPSYDEGKYWWTVNSEPIAKINHLHELQHIFRLCKIDKEIKI